MLQRSPSLIYPVLLAVLAPLAVVLGLHVLHSAWWTFLLYHVVFCLVFPVLESLWRGLNWREHRVLVGLSGGIPYTAVCLGLGSAIVTAGLLFFAKAWILPSGPLSNALARWGIFPEQAITLSTVMVLVNAPAEELFWRGYLPGRMAQNLPNTKLVQWLTTLITAILYTSYHAATIRHIATHDTVGYVMVGGVFSAGILWGWTRWRFGSVWMPLFGHMGAVIAYMIF